MFNNTSNIDASHSTFSEVHHDQYFTSGATIQGDQMINTIVHGNQIVQSHQMGLEALQKASAPSAAFDSVERHPAPRCLEGTRIHLLDQLSAWVNSEDEDHKRPICWIHGRPGSGKSAVSQTIAERFASKKRLAASFFFSRRDIERRTTRHFFPTIANQFLFSIPAIRPAILSALEEDNMIPFKVLREQMQKLLSEPLSSGANHTGSPLLFIVDALDECDDPRLVVELVSLLIQLVRNSPLPLRLLITSRPEPWLQAHFHQLDVASITLVLEIESFSAEDDIRSFLQSALNQVHHEHTQVMPDTIQWPSLEDLDRIVEKASGLFIFALTVVKFVGDRLHNPIQRLQAILEDNSSRDTAYSDLDRLYLDAISTFPDTDVVRLILGIVYCLSIPMSVPALHRLLDRPDVDVRIVIPALSSVLLSSDNGDQPIQFYHASFRDFLVSQQRSRKYTINPVVYHRLMALLCFKTMVHSLKRNMCGFSNPLKLNRDIEDLSERRKEVYDESLLYACRFWSHHLTQLPPEGGPYESLLDGMKEFCTKTLLYWIETASIFDEIEKAIIMLRDVLNWLKSLPIGTVPKETATLIEDAERLVLLYRLPISLSAQQVYHTAITFAPSSSALFARFKHHAGSACMIHQGQDDEWQAFQYAIDLDSITSVAFSPSGNVVATAGTDQGVQLWNVVTGGNVASLGDKSSSTLVRFANSGAFIGATFTDGTVTIWDPNLGREHLKDTNMHTQDITCLDFSPDSSFLASGARDHTLQLWSLDPAQRTHKLTAHEGPVTTLVFMPDSRRLCSGSDDNLIIIWDVNTGKAVRGMMGHRAGITALDVSHDGTMVVSGSQDKSVKVWDTRSGNCTRTLSRGHKSAVISVRFFDNGSRFLSASDGTILSSTVSSRKSSDTSVWDIGQNLEATMGNAPIWQTKALARGLPRFLLRKLGETNVDDRLVEQQTVVTYASQSSSFAFSYIAESWSAPLGSKVESPSIHVSQLILTSLALSPDGTRLASGNYVGSLEILDTTVPTRKWDEEMKRELGVPLRVASIMVPSPDGTRFLVMCGLTWYLTDSTFHLLTKVDFGIASYARAGDVPQPVFSADSSTFVWSMSDLWERQSHATLRAYESTTGTQKVRLSGLKKVQAFVVSSDGNLVGCGNEDGITLCDIRKQTKREVVAAADISVTALAFSSDSRTLMSGSKEGVLQLWEMTSGACKATFSHTEFDSQATAVGFAPGGEMAVITHKDGAVRLVCLTTSASHALCPSKTTFTVNVQDVLFSPSASGLKLTCKTDDNDVSFWAVPLDLFAAPALENGEEDTREDHVRVSCALCNTKEESSPEEGSQFESNPDVHDTDANTNANANANTDADTHDTQSPPLPHLISYHRTRVFDWYFRTPYAVRSDGWVCKGGGEGNEDEDVRLFWLPQHLRPQPSESQFSAFNGKMMILSHNRRVLFLTLRDDPR